MSTKSDVSTVNDLRRRYGHVPGMQEAIDAYLAEKHVARCAGVPPDVATTYSCDVFKDRIEKIMSQLLEHQGAGSSKASSSGRPGRLYI